MQSHFEIGRLYNRRKELHGLYGGQQQGCISTPSNAPFLLLFTGESGSRHGCQDAWTDDGVFLFTGEGQRGEMTFEKGNQSLRDHAIAGKTLHLFESMGRGQGYRYHGEFACGNSEYGQGVDVDGKRRRTIIFHLVRLQDLESVGRFTAETAQNRQDLRQLAYQAATEVSVGVKKAAKLLLYERCAALRQYVLARANGRCESCGQSAPFVSDDGTPYLELHHTRRVSDGGPDHPRWVGAVCPNCHSEMHHGIDGDAKNRELMKYLGEAEESSTEALSVQDEIPVARNHP
jgi:5-methylcytosine-specific restriction enzyme A